MLKKLFTILAILLPATPALARSISFKEAGLALWIFIIISAVIILMQLIPAAILFFSFVGTSTSMAFKKSKVEDVVGEEIVREEV